MPKRQPSLRKIDESGVDRSYYWGRLSREDAVDALTSRGVDGSFLLRMSTTQDGVYTLSIMCVTGLSCLL